MSLPLRTYLARAVERAKKSELLREFAYYSTTTVIWQGSKFAVTMVAAKVLGPTQFGLWYGLNLILVYGPFLQLGVLTGMNRDVPVFAARGLAGKVEAIHRSTLSFLVLVYGVAAIGPGIVAVLFDVQPQMRLALALMGPALFVQMLYVYYLIYLRASIRFDLLSRQQLLYSLVLPGVALPLTLWFGFDGFVSGQVLAGLLMCSFLFWLRGVRLSARIDWAQIRSLIGTGLPLLAAGLIYDVFSTLDRWVILSYLDQKQLGYYSLGILVTGMVRLLPQVVGEQVYPRMAKRFGETGDPAALRPLVLRQTVMTFALMSAAAAACTVILPTLVRSYYAEYVQGIPAMLIMVWGFLVVVPRSGLGNFLNAIGRQRIALVTQIIVVPPAILLMILSARMGFGIEGIAWSYVICNFVQTCMILALGWPLLKSRGTVPR